MQDFPTLPNPAMAVVPTPANVAPPPVIGPADLGLPALPPPPSLPSTAPAAPPSRLQTIIQALSGVAGGAMGPGAGTGLLQGMVMGQQRNDQQERLDRQEAMQAYRYEADAYDRQAREYDAAERRREQILNQSLTALRNQVKALPNEQAYNSYIDAYAAGLRGQGLRIGPEWLRQAVPFVPVNEREQAGTLFDDLLKSPINAQTFKTDPDTFLKGSMDVDLNGDGVPERVSVAELGLKGNRLARDANGKPVVLRENTPVDDDRFQVALNNARRIFRETNRREPTAQEDQQLLEEAITRSRIGSTSEFDDFVARRELEIGRKLTAGEYRAERQRFNNSGEGAPALAQRQARQALRAAMLKGGRVSRTVFGQLTAAGLDPQVEISSIREDFLRVGRQSNPYSDDVEALIDAGRAAMAGPGGQFETDVAPADPAALDALRAAFPDKQPGRPSAVPRQQPMLTPGQRYRYTPQGLVPVQ